MESAYICERQGKSFIYETIPTRLRRFAEEDPDREALVVYSSTKRRESLTRSQLVARSRAFARGLVSRGVERGDRIAICVPNCVEWLVYELGIMTAGAIPVHCYIDSFDLVRFFSLTRCWMLILDPAKDGNRWKELSKVVEVKGGGVVECESIPSLKLVVCKPGPYVHHGLLTSDLMLENGAEVETFPKTDPDDVAAVFPTSGSTGSPKYISHTHFSLINNFVGCCDDLEITSDDVYYVDRPLAWLGGFPFPFISSGTKHVTLETRIVTVDKNVDFTLKLWREEKCSVLLLFPNVVSLFRDTQMLNYSCRLVVFGGQVIREHIVKTALRFSEEVNIIYGSTNVLFGTTLPIQNDSKFKTGNCGRPIPGTELKIIDQEGNVVKRNQMGEVCLRSIAINNSIECGWVRMGDLAYISTDGELCIEGRIDDKITKGQRLVSPNSVETVVKPFPGVQEVVVFGVPDEMLGEEICACIETPSQEHFDVEKLRKFCDSKISSEISFDGNSNAPRYYFVLENFPKSPSGKVNRKKLREFVMKQLEEKPVSA